MTPIQRPDVEGLMREIDAASRLIESNPVVAHRVRSRRPVHVPPNPTIEANWDVWLPPEVTTHRRLGAPIVWLKRASLLLLRLHDREILKRQRDFNRQVKDELNALKRAVAELSGEVQSRQ